MKNRVKNFNNSYESEPSSSNSNLSTSEGIENNSFYEEDSGYPNLPQMLKSNKYKIINNDTDNNEQQRKVGKIKICGSTVYSSQESDFLGFPYENNDKDKLIGRKLKICGQTAFSSQESEFLGFSQVNDSLTKLQNDDEELEASGADDTTSTTENDEKNDCYKVEVKEKTSAVQLPLRDDSNSSLKFKFTSKFIPETGETIYEMISIENSCNAVDMKLSNNDNKKDITNTTTQTLKNLSFNGKINSLMDIENNVFSDNDTEYNLVIDKSYTEGNNSLNQNDKKIDENISMDCEIPKTIEEKKLINTNLIENTNRNEQYFSPSDNLLKLTSKEIGNEMNRIEINEQQKYINEASPDLFEDYDDIDFEATKKTHIENISSYIKEVLNDTNDESNILNTIKERDKKLLKKIEQSLTGLPPPPSVTYLQIDLFKSVTSQKNNIFEFMENLKNYKENNDKEGSDTREHLFKPSHNLEDVMKSEWPQILNVQYHGLSYNISTASEKIEILNLSVADRYIGAETATSFHLSPSSAKKRNMRLKQLTQSPGSRLSHLAKRRAIFSSANLQSNSHKLAANPNSNRQILLNTNKTTTNRRKLKIATPKRKTPGSRKKFARKTPTSSTKKRFIRTLEYNKSGPPSRETSKRALFQSPPQQKPIIIPQPKPLFKPEIANRIEKSKRALFSPEKFDFKSSLSQMSTTSTSSLFGSIENLAKRKRVNDNEDVGLHNKKIFCSDNRTTLCTENLTPRALKIKSQSFCGNGSGTRGSLTNNSMIMANGKSLFRANSDMTFCSSHLTDSHKKKLLWAVSLALQKKNIGVGHSDFKKYASILAKSVKRLFLEYYFKSNSTSDTMLRLSKKYVYCVMHGKTADDVYLMEKNDINNEKVAASTKLTGYIAPDDYANFKKLPIKKTNSFAFLSESSVDSFNFSQSYGCGPTQSTQNSEHTKFSQNSLLSVDSSNMCAINNKLPIQPNKTLQNSSSKNNLNGLALRENVDCEQRKSGLKNFTGKDQRNVSPYLEKVRLLSNIKKTFGDSYDLNAVKAKRQLF